MSSNKCRNCGLVNGVSDRDCRRCGCELASKAVGRPLGPREAAKRSSILYTLLAVTLIGGSVYYLIYGFGKSYDEIKASEANRLSAQPKVSPAPLTSRAESDRQRVEPYKNAVANNPNLAASQKHNDDVKRLMQPANQPQR
jgi:hypothetical protein